MFRTYPDGEPIKLNDNTKLTLTSDLKNIRKINDKEINTFLNKIIDENAYMATKKKKTLDHTKRQRKLNYENIKNKQLIMLYALSKNKVVGVLNVLRHNGNFDHVCGMGITLKKEFRNKRLGTLLVTKSINQIKETFKGIKIIELSVYENNLNAIHLYTNIGFQEVARIPKSLQWENNGKIELKDKIIMHYYLV